MGRPLTGKLHVGERREIRPNGDVYVYERIAGYDPKTQKTKTISTRLLGKIPARSTEMVPTRLKKKSSEVAKESSGNVATSVQSERTHVGLQKIPDRAGRESGIDGALKLSSVRSVTAH